MQRLQYDLQYKAKYCLNLLTPDDKKLANPYTARKWDLNQILAKTVTSTSSSIDLNTEMISEVASNKSLNSKVEFLWKVDQLLLMNIKPNELKKVHDSSTFRKEFLELAEKHKEQVPLSIICASIGISSKKFYSWKRRLRCKSSLKELCRLQHPNQLLVSEVKLVKKYLTNYLPILKAKNAVHAKMIRDNNGVFMGLTTFYEYANLHGFTNKKKREKMTNEGIRASSPFECIHMDVSRIPFGDRDKAYLYAIKDNYSKAILSYAVHKECNASHSKENLKQAIKNFGKGYFSKTQLITDDGSENKGDVLKFLKGNTKIIHRIAQSDDLRKSNSCIETYFRTLKSFYLSKSDLASYNKFMAVIDDYVHHYNFERYRQDLDYRSPMEMLHNLDDSIKDIPSKMKEARKIRVTENKVFNCARFCIVDYI